MCSSCFPRVQQLYSGRRGSLDALTTLATLSKDGARKSSTSLLFPHLILFTFIFTVYRFQNMFSTLLLCSFVKCSLVFHDCRGSLTFRKRTLKETTELTWLKDGPGFSFDQAGMQLVWARLCNIWHFGFHSFCLVSTGCSSQGIKLKPKVFYARLCKGRRKKKSCLLLLTFPWWFLRMSGPQAHKKQL